MKEKTKLEQMVNELRIANLLPDINKMLIACDQKKMTPKQTLEHVFSKAIARKHGNKTEMLTKMARLPTNETLKTYDFSHGYVSKSKIDELATCDWIANGENVLFRGAPGLGKTHLAVAIGRQAIAKGYSTLYLTANDFFERATQAYRKNRLQEMLKTLQRNQLIILDDIGHYSNKQDLDTVFYELVDGRYQKTSLLITANLEIDEWATTLGQTVTVQAAIDRIIEGLHDVPFAGSSYRCKQFKERNVKNTDSGKPQEATGDQEESK